MTIFEILKEAIAVGIRNDFRSKEEVLNYFWQETIMFGHQSFVNPYPDSGLVLVKNLGARVKRMAVGIDIDSVQVACLKEWEKLNHKKIDLILVHHPLGRVLASYPWILKTQLGNLASCGLKVAVLEKHFDKQTQEIAVDILASNFNQIEEILKLFDYDCIVVHTPADNTAARYIENLLQQKKPKTLKDCQEVLQSVPECQLMQKQTGLSVQILVGKPRDKLGKFLLTEFTGGEEGPKQIYSAIKNAGFETLITMYLSKEGLAQAQKQGLNVIGVGHTASDSLGLNFICDIIEKRGIDIIPIGGFIRHSRNSHK